ncbi:NAD-dependent epimerase/dehydratase family protein [Geodermatophilus nigrescens]|uniref:2'-hydroxyisoflavone reductase n=1 Tax=Geodermatophilus nigrescens TaxID=1070870 RepID=A0A1M5IA47_9ACTN|nr:NAD-dependent epimerase/dehydratase family protein [Geodermatophilus nigrescens]SHG25176.1 2'-hydroxyisoflavone reductase [Geodermatophilus nigrescens]
MRFLVLGGGGFLGAAVVDAAVAAGDSVTVFSRSGRPPADGVEVLTGDRRGDLGVLAGRRWDAVLDTFTDDEPGAPAVAATARLLSGSVGAYGYVSGMSVYAPDGPAVPDETAPVRAAGQQPDDDPLQQRSLAKLAAERALAEHFDGPVLVPRVGIMVGPRDPSDRFTWWPVRIAEALAGRRDRRVCVPGDPTRPVQFSDARDVAGWVVAMLRAGRGGVFDTVGPGRRQTLASVLDACLAAAGGGPGDVEFVPVGEEALRRGLAGVEEERRPLWFPEDQIPQEAVDSSAALAAGLTFRPVEDTARDTLHWVRRDRGTWPDLDVDLDAARERALLAAD